MSVERTVYRSLLRLAAGLDRNPIGKALLIGQPHRIFNRSTGSVMELPEGAETADQAVAGLLQQFNRGAEHYTPSSSVRAMLRQEARAGHSLDTALAALRVLSMAQSGGGAGGTAWAH